MAARQVYPGPSRLTRNIGLPEFMDYATYHPLFLYESIFNLLNMGFLLIWLSRKVCRQAQRRRHLPDLSDFLSGVSVFYGVYLRLDNSLVGAINANQTLMLVIAVAAAAYLIWRHRETLFRNGTLLHPLRRMTNWVSNHLRNCRTGLMSRIIFLGTANAVPNINHHNAHFILESGQRLVLVDCSGNPIVRLEEAGIDPFAAYGYYPDTFSS